MKYLSWIKDYLKWLLACVLILGLSVLLSPILLVMLVLSPKKFGWSITLSLLLFGVIGLTKDPDTLADKVMTKVI